MSPQPQIALKDALDTIANTLASVNTNLQGHQILQQCVALIRSELEANRAAAGEVDQLRADLAAAHSRATTLKRECQELGLEIEQLRNAPDGSRNARNGGKPEILNVDFPASPESNAAQESASQ